MPIKLLLPLIAVLFALNASAKGLLLSPMDYQVVQRDAQNMGIIPVTVRDVPADASVRVRAIPGPEALHGKPTAWMTLKRTGDTFAGDLVTLRTMPEKGIVNLRFFAKARIASEAADAAETGNRLTGYAVSEPVILPITAPSR